MTDPSVLLDHHRPELDQLAQEWPAQARGHLLNEILSQPRAPAHHRRAWVLTGVAVAVAAAVVTGIGLPSGTPASPDLAGAATLDNLAVIAGHSGPSVGTGQYAYTAETSQQSITPGAPIDPGYLRVGNLEQESTRSWTASGGDVWFFRSLGRPAACLSGPQATTGDPSRGDYQYASAAKLATLPTDPTQLASYIDAHPSGQNSGAANRLRTVSDLVRSGLATPQLRSAALSVLAATPGLVVTSSALDALGRPAIRVDEALPHDDIESLFFDPKTSALLEEQNTQGSYLYRSLITASGTVDHLPAGLPTC